MTHVANAFLYDVWRWGSPALAYINSWIGVGLHGRGLCAPQCLGVVELLWSLVLLYGVWYVFRFEGVMWTIYCNVLLLLTWYEWSCLGNGYALWIELVCKWKTLGYVGLTRFCRFSKPQSPKIWWEKYWCKNPSEMWYYYCCVVNAYHVICSQCPIYRGNCWIFCTNLSFLYKCLR